MPTPGRIATLSLGDPDAEDATVTAAAIATITTAVRTTRLLLHEDLKVGAYALAALRER